MKHFMTIAALALSSTVIAQTDCPNPHDSNDDGAVTISDLLDLLGLFGDVDTDQDGVWDSGDDCVDTNACNYANDPSESCAYIDVLGICGGGCQTDEDADGVCDDVDNCVGVIDECGVCNGPGPTGVVIEEITVMYDSVYAEQIDTWFVFEAGADTTFSYTCDCVDPVNYQGYDYATILIGDQCWFAENLRNENYRNGDDILANSGWSTATSGAATVYGGNLDTYGRLYNGYAVSDSRSLCPNGWHVPTDDEWTVMIEFLGGEVIAGSQMKADYGWQSDGNGTNSSGFSGLPGGYRFENGAFSSAGLTGIWWSSSSSINGAWSRQLSLSSPSVNRSNNNLQNGFSVRCVRDFE